MIDLQPHLVGELTDISPTRASDWEELYAVASDPVIWAIHPARNRHEEKEFREYFDTGMASGGALTIRDRTTGKMIGASRYHGWDPVLREVEIGWTFLATACWGGRYNREVKWLMLGHAFTFADTVVFWVGETNLRSRRAMEKIGGALRPGMFERSHGEMSFPYVIYEIANRPGWEAPLLRA
jgi:RimJ/RimL family protein N-acetyltransferase